MAVHNVNLSNYYVKDDNDSIGKSIYRRGIHGDTLCYKIIRLPASDIVDFHACVRHLCKDNDWFPMMLYPVTLSDGNEYLGIESAEQKSLNLLEPDWFFESGEVYDKTTKKFQPKLSYPTLRFKKLIWSIVRTVDAFAPTRFRPMFDLTKMYVTNNDQIAFTAYELRGANHNLHFELGQFRLFMINLLNSKGALSVDVLKLEFDSFLDCFLGVNLQNLILGSLDDILEEVVFWPPRLRILYILNLYEHVEAGTTKIYPVAEYAFDKRDWRAEIKGSKHDGLNEILDAGDDHYRDKLKRSGMYHVSSPSHLRDIKVSSNDLIALNQGLTRIRDAHMHVLKNQKIQVKAKYTDEDLQLVFHHFFPRHVLEFSKARSLINFTPKPQIIKLLR